MARYVTSVPTPLLADAAFAYMADVTHFADWDPGVTSAALVSGRGPDAVYDVDVRGVGRTFTLRYRVTEFDAPRRLVLVAETSWLRSVDEVRVEPTAVGSVVTYDADLQLRGLLRFADPLLAAAFRRIGDRAAAGLRRVLRAADVAA